jgi:hypothetical protein
VFVNGFGVWHLGLLGVFALVVLGVVVLVVALVTSASRQPPGGGAPGLGSAGYPGQAGYPGPPGPVEHPGYSVPPAYPGADPMGGPVGEPTRYAAAPGAAQPTGARSVEQRLADLEDLHRRGVINADEYAAARIRILGEL